MCSYGITSALSVQDRPGQFTFSLLTQSPHAAGPMGMVVVLRVSGVYLSSNGPDGCLGTEN